MISNLSIQSQDTAIAEGQRFDSKRVLCTFDVILRGLIAEICLMCPGTRPSWRTPGGEDLPLLSESDFAGLLAFFQSCAIHHEVVETAISVHAGPYHISLHPLGSDQLYQDSDADQPSLKTAEPWHELDPTPRLLVMFDESEGIRAELNEGNDILDVFRGHPPSGGEILVACAQRHAPQGTLVRVDGWLEITFPHEVFGQGMGPLRIALLRVY